MNYKYKVSPEGSYKFGYKVEFYSGNEEFVRSIDLYTDDPS